MEKPSAYLANALVENMVERQKDSDALLGLPLSETELRVFAKLHGDQQAKDRKLKAENDVFKDQDTDSLIDALSKLS